jgi:hypothetical protein
MDMKQVNKPRPSIAWLATGLVFSTGLYSADLERPPVQFVDKFGVNLANGQVTHSLGTVSIGGAMGLSHSVSVYANEFNFPGMRGFADKYYNRADEVQLCTSPSACNPMTVMRVQDWSDSQSFAFSGTSPSGYSPVSDERHSLEVSGSEFLWTKPDGTVVHFNRGAPNRPSNWGGTLSKVVYPNGFTIWVNQGSVNTNTGFQLKYQFDGTNPPLDKTEPPNLQAPIVDATWHLLNPKRVVAVNSWKVRCPWTTGSCLDSLNGWPFAEFSWPAGMPRTMYIGDSLVKVTDSARRVSTYKFRAYDLAYDEFGAVIPPYVAGREFSPRLKEIIPPGATATVLAYDYKNLFRPNMAQLDYRLQSAGVVKTASRLSERNDYVINQDYMGDTFNWSAPHAGVSRVFHRNVYGNPSGTNYVDTLDGRIWFENSGRNFPYQFDRSGWPTEQYFYETRSNLTRVAYNDPAGEGYQIVAEYPVTCTNRKTCNQATRISDAKGNWTDYAYYPESGLVKSITYPANKHGVRAQTRFTYVWKRATYFNPVSSAVEQAPPEHGLWLKATEEFCINSAASEGNCAGNDEVVTSYEYNHPNLLLTGTLVTSPDGSRRTCYRYDDFGNQIGVSTPNAALTACPGVTP